VWTTTVTCRQLDGRKFKTKNELLFMQSHIKRNETALALLEVRLDNTTKTTDQHASKNSIRHADETCPLEN